MDIATLNLRLSRIKPAMVHAEYVHDNNDNDHVRMQFLCPFCLQADTETLTSVVVPTSELLEYIHEQPFRPFIAETFTGLSESQIETVMSGLCPSCQDDFFKDSEVFT